MKYRFIHIPKCGGTSIKNSLDIKTGHQTLQTLVDSMKFDNILEDTFIFAFIRNPYDRMASFYRSIRKANRNGLRDSGIGFEDWFYLTLVNHQKPWFYREEHFAPSYDWLTVNGNLEADFVGKLENVEADFNTLCDILKVDAELSHLNKTTPNSESYTDDMKKHMKVIFEKDFKTWYPEYYE